jgi:hypothetical protein
MALERHPDFPQIDSLDLHTRAPVTLVEPANNPVKEKMHQPVLVVDSMFPYGLKLVRVPGFRLLSRGQRKANHFQSGADHVSSQLAL